MPVMDVVHYRIFGDGMQYVEVEIDPGCIVGFQQPVQYDIQYIGRIKTALFAGRGREEGRIPGNPGGILNGE